VEPALRVNLPTGLFRDGTRHGEAAVRALTGADELLVQEAAAAGEPRAGVVSALLAACTRTIGEVHPVDEQAVDALSAGDREALLLHLHRLTFGDAVQAVVLCPACGETLDLDLKTSTLLLPQTAEAEAEVVVDLSVAGETWRARLRRPTGADQRAALHATDAAAALLARCAVEVIDADGAPRTLATLPDAASEALDRALAALDPQADIRLDVACPACGERFAASFDAAGHLFAELAAESNLLLHDVAAIARTLHWSEGDILDLPRARRRSYAALASGR
jgi:hypothetical protein